MRIECAKGNYLISQNIFHWVYGYCTVPHSFFFFQQVQFCVWYSLSYQPKRKETYKDQAGPCTQNLSTAGAES